MVRRKHLSGLTLIELIIAVALMALLSTMAYRGLDSMVRTSDRMLSEGERWQSIALFFERFGSDATQPAAQSVRVGGATTTELLPAWWGQPLPEASGPQGAELEFTRKSPSGRDAIRLGYRLRDGRVELLIWDSIDRAPDSAPEAYTLLEGVSSLRFLHLDARGTWQEHWPLTGSEEKLPRAVAVELILNDGLSLRRVFALPS